MGCDIKTPVVTTIDGESVVCEDYSSQYCGVNLYNCTGPHKEYRCMHDLPLNYLSNQSPQSRAPSGGADRKPATPEVRT
jgi:hypothetical protein